MKNRKLRMGVVGGGRDAFIGPVHRMAAGLDGGVELIAGALSSTPEKSIASGRDLGLADERNYADWREMIDGEKSRPANQRIDFVSIVTPNDTHFDIAKAFLEAGIHVVLDKPMVHTGTQADELVQLVNRTGLVFCVTYNYSGYPMVKQARAMVEAGELGEIRKIIVEYNQGWLATALEETGQKQASWRTDPARSGIGGAIGDIGSHAEQLVSYVTGLEIEKLCADLTTFLPGRRLDDDANVLIRYGNGARGLLTASQICVGNENDLRLRIWGERGGLEWHQEEPNHLVFKSAGKPECIFRRGNDYVTSRASAATRLPSGHPEAFIEAFANVYAGACDAMRAKIEGVEPRNDLDYPTVIDGVRGVHFIEKVVESSKSEVKWTNVK